MEAFHELIDMFLWYDEDKKIDWKRCITEWKKVISMALQREEFTDDTIDDFSSQCDFFFEAWVVLHGLVGMTDYFQMIGSGHMTYFHREWHNLYLYSQLGWKALNSLHKNIYGDDFTDHPYYALMGGCFFVVLGMFYPNPVISII